MNSLHSLQQNLLIAGTIYGWRLDAMLMGGLLWILIGLLCGPVLRPIDIDSHHRG